MNARFFIGILIGFRALCTTSHRSFSVAGLMRRAVARAVAADARYAVRHIQSARPC
jgi:hypothetical protein